MCPGGLAACPFPRLLTLSAMGLVHSELFDLGRTSGSGGRVHEVPPAPAASTCGPSGLGAFALSYHRKA